MLQKGSKGDSVKALQLLLVGYGYSLGDYGADSSFGSVTENAVEAFQEDCDLEVDGVVGPMTWAKLLGV
jgi:peptidoglycan hydrolase-like protein with peptidoglycan-binding domain